MFYPNQVSQPIFQSIDTLTYAIINHTLKKIEHKSDEKNYSK